jgi:hypothetical protein
MEDNQTTDKPFWRRHLEKQKQIVIRSCSFPMHIWTVYFVKLLLTAEFGVNIIWIWHRVVCKILGFHGGDYEECHLQGCVAMWLL